MVGSLIQKAADDRADELGSLGSPYRYGVHYSAEDLFALISNCCEMSAGPQIEGPMNADATNDAPIVELGRSDESYIGWTMASALALPSTSINQRLGFPSTRSLMLTVLCDVGVQNGATTLFPP